MNERRPRGGHLAAIAFGIAALLAAGALIVGYLQSQPTLGPADGHDLVATDLDRVQVGDEAPNFSLRALSGDVYTLADFRGRRNVVLVFYRGHW